MRAAALLAIALVATGCGAVASIAMGPSDDLATWSRTPLAPDAELTAQARRSCGGGNNPLPFLLQDRRTRWTAIVLFGDDDEYSMCTASHRRGGGFGAGGAEVGGNAPPGPAMTISGGAGGVGDARAVVVDGTVLVPATRIVVLRADGLAVEASVAGGRWLAWWPGDVPAARAIAYDAGGVELARVEASR